MNISLNARLKRLEQRAGAAEFRVFVGAGIARQNSIVISEDDEKL